jgi:putative transposase
MAIKLKHSDSFSTYFVTFTCTEWISLFEITNTYDMVYKWFDILKTKHDADVVAYVVMPNHLHVILHFQKTGFNLTTIIANGKRFMPVRTPARKNHSGGGSSGRSL